MDSCNTWNFLKLDDVLELIRNGTTTKQNKEKKGYPVTRIQTISSGVINPKKFGFVELDQKQVEKYKLIPGDILFSHINSVKHIGKTALYDGEPEILIHGMNLLLLRPKKEIVYPEYLHFFLKSEYVRSLWRTRARKAVNQASLNQTNIANLKIPVPSLVTQKKIAMILKKTVHLINRKKQVNQIINSLNQATFLKMFGNPVTNIRNWETKIIDNITSIKATKGSTPTTYGHKWEKEGILFLRSECITPNRISMKGSMYISNGAHDSMQRSKVYPRDILIRITGDVGISSIFPQELGEANINQHIAVIRLAEKSGVEPIFLVNQLNLESFREYYASITRGVTHPHLSLKQIRETKIIVPPTEVQKKFVFIASKIDSLTKKNLEHAQKSTEIYNSLISKAFKGEFFS